MYHLREKFKPNKLPPHLKAISDRFNDLAFEMSCCLPINKESLKSLKKIMDAKELALKSFNGKGEFEL